MPPRSACDCAAREIRRANVYRRAGRTLARFLAVVGVSLPLYWPLQTYAMGRPLYGLARCPQVWAKTPHRVAF